MRAAEGNWEIGVLLDDPPLLLLTSLHIAFAVY